MSGVRKNRIGRPALPDSFSSGECLVKFITPRVLCNTTLGSGYHYEEPPCHSERMRQGESSRSTAQRRNACKDAPRPGNRSCNKFCENTITPDEKQEYRAF